MGVNISKRHFSYKWRAKNFKLFLKSPPPPNGPHETTLGIFEIWSFSFLTISFRKLKFPIIIRVKCKTLNLIIWKTSDCIVKRGEIWVSWVVVVYIWGKFDLVWDIRFFPENMIFEALLLLHLTLFFIQTFYSCPFWQTM